MPQGQICSSSSRLLVNLFFLAGPGPLHGIAVSAFPRSPLGRENTFSFPYLILNHRTTRKCSSSLTFHSASRSVFYILSFTSVLFPPHFSMDTITSWFPLVSLPYFPDYIIPPCSRSSFCHFFPYSPFSYGWQPLFRHVPHQVFYYAISSFSRLYLF